MSELDEAAEYEPEVEPRLPSRSQVLVTGPISKKRNATAEPGPIMNGHKHKHIMHNGVSKFLKKGVMAKGGKYGWWSEMPPASRFAK